MPASGRGGKSPLWSHLCDADGEGKVEVAIRALVRVRAAEHAGLARPSPGAELDGLAALPSGAANGPSSSLDG